MEDGLLLGLQFDINNADAEQRLKLIESALKNIEKQTGATGIGIDKLPKQIEQNANKTISKLEVINNKIKSIANSFKMIGNTGKWAFLGITGLAGISIKKYAEMEAGIRKVRTISKREFESIEKDARKLAVKYGIDVNKILEGNYQMVSSVGDVKQAYEVLDTTSKLSIAGFTDYADALNGLIAIINGYKMNVDDVGRVSDILITVQNRGITTVNELQATLSRVTSTASTVGLNFEDLAASMATITSNKVNTAEAVTYMNQMLSELGDRSKETSKMFERAMGESFQKYLKNGGDFIEGLVKLNEQMKKEGKDALSSFGNQTGAMAFLNLVGKNVDKYKDTMKEIQNSFGATDKALAELNKGFLTRINKIKTRLGDLGLSIGQKLLPSVEKFVDWLEKIDWDKLCSEENIERIITIGKEIVVVTGALWGVNKALESISNVSTIIMASKGFIPWLAGGGASALGIGAGTTMAGFGIGIGYGVYKLNEMDKQNAIDNANLKAQNAELNNKIALLRAMQQDIQHGIINTDFYKGVTNLTSDDKQLMKTLDTLKDKLETGGDTDRLLDIANRALEVNINYLQKKKEEADKALNQVEEAIEKANEENNINLNGESSTVTKFKTEYLEDLEGLPEFWDMIGLSDKDKFNQYLNYYTDKLKEALKIGNKSIIDMAFKDFKKYQQLINEVNHKEEIKNYSEESSENLKIKDTIQRYNKEIESTEKAIKELRKINSVKNKADIEELQAHADYMKKLKEAREKEIQAAEEQAERTKDLIQSLNVAIDGINTLANATGSKKIGMAGNMLGGISAISRASSSFKGIGSITGMFGGGNKALTTGLGSLGALAGGVGAGIGIISSIGGIFGRKGKKQKAKIDAENKRNQELYKEQLTAMEQLTQAIEANTERIKTFGNRMLNDVAKNPTLRTLTGGTSNFTIMQDMMIAGKHFGNINAIEKGRKRYSKGWGRHGHKDTFTNVSIATDSLLKYLGFDKTNVDHFNASEMKQLSEALRYVNHDDLKRATGRNLTESNIEEWKKQINIFVDQYQHLEKEQSKLFAGATLESFSGIQYREHKELIAEYTEMFKELGLNVSLYNDEIEELARNNQVLATSMQDVRRNTIAGMVAGGGGFVESSKQYFEQVYSNAASVAYDIAFSDIDRYMSDQFIKISDKLVDIKRNEVIDFNHLLDDFDFSIFERADAIEQQATKSLDVIKQQLLNSGVDISLINKMLPMSDFNDRINSLKDALANAVNEGLKEHSFFDFTKTLGQSLYETTKGALVKAFSESNLYQGMIQKFIKAEDYQSKLEKAGNFKEAIELSEKIMEDFGHELEANGLGGFDAINNLKKEKNNMLGNAYYQDDNKGVSINITNNFNKDVYGLQDFQSIIRNTTLNGIKEYFNKPRILA